MTLSERGSVFHEPVRGRRGSAVKGKINTTESETITFRKRGNFTMSCRNKDVWRHIERIG